MSGSQKDPFLSRSENKDINILYVVPVKLHSSTTHLGWGRGQGDLYLGVEGEGCEGLEGVAHRGHALVLQLAPPRLLDHGRQVGVLLPQLVLQHPVPSHAARRPAGTHQGTICFTHMVSTQLLHPLLRGEHGIMDSPLH